MACVLAATAAWVGAGRPLPLPEISIAGAPAQPEPPQPQAVALAHRALAGRGLAGAERERLGDGKQIICAADHSCALIERGNQHFLVSAEAKAEHILRKAARQGEPR
jgi:hypothetical protein